MGPGYLRDQLSWITSACPTVSGRQHMLWVPSARDLHGGPQEVDLLCCGSRLMKHSPLSLKVSLAPLLLMFHRSFKTLVCHPVQGSQGTGAILMSLAFNLLSLVPDDFIFNNDFLNS